MWTMADSTAQGGAPGPESAWSVHTFNEQVKGWVEKLGHVWVEGQIVQISMKASWKLAYIILRDMDVETSVKITTAASMLRNLPTPLQEGDRVVMYGKPAFYAGRGEFSLWASQIRLVGLGELLARIEQLKKTLAAEGLFDPRLKSPLPFLPQRVGLITGRGSAAERDVLAVAHDRWPEIQFEVINTAVQGTRATGEVIEALKRLEENPEVDVIIVARGGGSVEDLLPFSEESLVRQVSRMRTPVVSAIGHEPDTPLLDNVADLRAATPTDAAKRVVPDVVAERQLIAELRDRAAGALRQWVANERRGLASVRSRPILADPLLPVRTQQDLIDQALERKDRALGQIIREMRSQVHSLRAQANALGPSQTLARGYSIVQVVPRDGSETHVVTTVDEVSPGSQLRVRVSDGSVTAAAMSVQRAPGTSEPGTSEADSPQQDNAQQSTTDNF